MSAAPRKRSTNSEVAELSGCLSLQDDTSKSSSTANELGLANVGGVFVVLMGGMGVACVVAVCEFVWKSRKVAVEERVSWNFNVLYNLLWWN